MSTQLGTILPTKRSLAISKKMYEIQQAEELAIAEMEGITAFRRVVEGGETQYWDSPNSYAIVGRSGRIKWFELRGGIPYAKQKGE